MANDTGESKGRSSRPAVLLITILSFMSMVFVMLYQQRLISDTLIVSNELKLVHNAERFLSRALREKDFAQAKLDEGEAAMVIEEKLLEQAKALLRKEDRKGLEKLLRQEEAEERAAKQAMAVAKARESKARVAERAAEEVSKELNVALSNAELLYDYKEDIDALAVLNASLSEFEALDKALEARQQAIHADLERIRHSRSKGYETRDSQKFSEKEVSMAKRAEEKESEATGALERADKDLKLAEHFLEKHNGKGAKNRLKDEEKEEKSIDEALNHAKSLLENAQYAHAQFQNASASSKGREVVDSADSNRTSDDSAANLLRLEREAQELQDKRDAIHEKHDQLKRSIKLEEKRRKLLGEEKHRVRRERELQKHALALKARVVKMMSKEDEILHQFTTLVEEGKPDAALEKVGELEKLNMEFTEQFDKIEKDVSDAHRQVSEAVKLSKRLSSEMAIVGGQDAKVEKSLSFLRTELKKLEKWRTMAVTKHEDVLKQVDSIKESQGI